MATQSPFSWVFQAATELVSGLRPPNWVADEIRNRLILLLNHVIQQEPAAQQRLARQSGKCVLVRWQSIEFSLRPTAAGLLEHSDQASVVDLRLTVTEADPLQLARKLFDGDKPAVHVEGDVQLAAEINWLVDHLRWDLEEDLSRLIGDVPAHTLGELGRAVARAVRDFVRTPRGSTKAGS
jgi:ubiquinone biosynthesis protein UbiJ